MIRHVVMWKFKDEAEGKSKQENLEKVKSMLDALPAKIDQINSFEMGMNVKESDAAYDAVLVSTFNSLEELEEYRVHPEHVKVSQYVSKVRTNRAVVDFEI